MREIHTHALHVALARDRLDHLPRDREGLSHTPYSSTCSSLRVAGVGHVLGVRVRVRVGRRVGRREAADEEAALVEGERGVLDAEVARARDVREGAPDDDVRRRAPVRVRAGLHGPERSPHRVYISFAGVGMGAGVGAGVGAVICTCVRVRERAHKNRREQ